MNDPIEVFPDSETLARAAATLLVQLAVASIKERGIFLLALSGGSTPKILYKLLATDPAFAALPWKQSHFFFGDERHVPPDDKDSNYRMTRETLLSTGLVPEENVHRVPAEMPEADAAAAAYERDLRAFFADKSQLAGVPRFDLILLGMGPDGHTASLFPGSPGLVEQTRWVIANHVEKFQTDRITFTYPVLNAAREVHLLVAGADKAPMIAQILGPTAQPDVYPVQRVHPSDGKKLWLLDEAAAAQLPSALR